MKKQQNSVNCVTNPLYVNFQLQHGDAPCATEYTHGTCPDICWFKNGQQVTASADPDIICYKPVESDCTLPNGGPTCSALMNSSNTACNNILNESDCSNKQTKGNPVQQCIWASPPPPPPPPPPSPPGPKPPSPPGPKPPPSYIGPMIIIALIMILLGGVGIYFMFPKTK